MTHRWMVAFASCVMVLAACAAAQTTSSPTANEAPAKDEPRTDEASTDPAPKGDAGTGASRDASADAPKPSGNGFVKLEGDVDDPQSCEDMCQAIGKRCENPDSQYASYGAMCNWVHPDSGKPCGQIVFCPHAPPKTNECWEEGVFGPLVSYDCYCR